MIIKSSFLAAVLFFASHASAFSNSCRDMSVKEKNDAPAVVKAAIAQRSVVSSAKLCFENGKPVYYLRGVVKLDAPGLCRVQRLHISYISQEPTFHTDTSFALGADCQKYGEDKYIVASGVSSGLAQYIAEMLYSMNAAQFSAAFHDVARSEPRSYKRLEALFSGQKKYLRVHRISFMEESESPVHRPVYEVAFSFGSQNSFSLFMDVGRKGMTVYEASELVP